MWENRLRKNELVLRGRRVDLARITVPFLHVMAEHDHIVPYESAKDLIGMVGSADKRDLVLKGGHVSLVAGPNAKPTQLTFSDPGYIDYLGRPWAQNWEEHFEQGWQKPADGK